MKILNGSSNQTWQEIKEDADEAYRKENVFRTISDKIQAENLVILCGLGTSRCLLDSANNPIAPSMSDLMDAVKEMEDGLLSQVIEKIGYNEVDQCGNNVELLLSKCQMAYELKNDTILQDFIQKAEKLILQKCQFVKSDSNLNTHESMLRKIAKRSSRLPRTKIFTTNYDLCFETAARRTGFTVIDGFSHSYDQEFDGAFFNYDIVQRTNSNESFDFITNVFHLYKLHGSVDWDIVDGKIFRNQNPENPCMIFPRSSKYQYSYSQPYIEMMSRFQTSLRYNNLTLLVIGFGFNDFHLTQPILSSIKSNVSLNVVIVSPDLEDSRNQTILNIIEYAKSGDTRLTLLNGTFDELITYLPSVDAITENDIHNARFRG